MNPPARFGSSSRANLCALRGGDRHAACQFHPLLGVEIDERPTLETALRLELIYRVPVAFLFPSLYEGLRSKVRAAEDLASAIPGQQALI